MHIKVNRQNFLTAVRIVEKSIKDNKIKPILSCVYAKVKDNKVYFTGTNLDTTIKTSIDVNEVIREGEVAFSPSIIDEYLKEIKDEFVVLRVENGNILFIETEDSTTEYDVFTTEDYPNTFENINLNENNFIVTNGGSEALSFALASICDDGDEVIIPEPYYANYCHLIFISSSSLLPSTSLLTPLLV